MESLDKVEDAMKFYLKAKDVLQNTKQFKLLGLVTEKIGDLNRRQKLLDTALNDYKESFDYYASIPDSLYMIYAYRNLGRGFYIKIKLIVLTIIMIKHCIYQILRNLPLWDQYF